MTSKNTDDPSCRVKLRLLREELVVQDGIRMLPTCYSAQAHFKPRAITFDLIGDNGPAILAKKKTEVAITSRHVQPVDVTCTIFYQLIDM